MNLFTNFNRLFRDYLSWTVLAATGIALFLPNYFTWATAIVTYLLQFIMFTMGLTMTLKDFSEVFRKPTRILLVEVAQYLFMPFSAFMLSQLFHLPSEMALGLILVGSVPGGTSSNVITYLANGDVPLSISATSVSTLLSPLLTPFMLSLYGGAYLEVSFMAMFLSIVKVVLVPVVLGLLVNYFFGSHTQKIGATLPTLSSVAVLVVLMGTVAVNRNTLLSTGALMFFVVFLHNLSGYSFGYLLGFLFKLDKKTTRAMAVEIGLQNTGLAASLGLAHFSPIVAVAGAAGAVVHTLFGSLYANLCAARDARDSFNLPFSKRAKSSVTSAS
ncbi:bile acid:sodium symporter family protein [Aerococcaceae bacterium zg-B36]|uniref:bile acid:sodium symporter family protein n=1 Tax=Aerococcaceae bacterium zg-252 TaxID=2796928 RepID=UPI001BD81DA3|nr:bile acid:sodium symporter family protein [Aerococcaceae bacterium zg-B36]